MYQISAHFDMKQRRNYRFPSCLGNEFSESTPKINGLDILHLGYNIKLQYTIPKGT